MISNKKFFALVVIAFVLCLFATSAMAALVLDDPLQGSTIGTRSGGQFVTGGWKVIGKDDCIYWHVPSISQGAAEYDVKGLYPNECRTGMEDKAELFHMYDYTVGNSDINYNGGYRDNPYKHFTRKIGCMNHNPNAMEFVWKIGDNYVEPDSPVLSWDPNTTYHFREEWGPDGQGNSVLRVFRDGVLILTASQPGNWTPTGMSVRIAASPRRDPAAGAPIDAIFSNIKVWDSLELTAPSVTAPANGETVKSNTPFIKWSSGMHSHYQVRICTSNSPDSGVVWDSG